MGWAENGLPMDRRAISSIVASVGWGPRPQLAPTTCTSRWRNRSSAAATVWPARVRPSSSKVSCATTGRSHAVRIPSTARASSSASPNVSAIKRAAPPSRSPSACSRKMARTRSGSISRTSASGLPSGPMAPATKTFSPATSRASRAILTPCRLISRTRSSRPCGARRTRLAPNVLVSMTSAPART